MSLSTAQKFISLGMPTELAKVVAAAIESAGTSVTWDEVSGKPATFAPTIGTTATTAMAGNTPIPAASTVAGAALAAAGAVGVSAAYARADHVHPLPAIPAASTTAPANLAAAAAVGTGTTFARADHVHAIPGVSAGATRGTVLIQTAEADLAGGADLPTTVTKVNAVLAKLRTAGVLST